MKKNKKGFTLIELLAVIAILAIIMLIAVPQVLGMIERARKGAFRDSCLALIKQIETDIALEKSDVGSDYDYATTMMADLSSDGEYEMPLSVVQELMNSQKWAINGVSTGTALDDSAVTVEEDSNGVLTITILDTVGDGVKRVNKTSGLTRDDLREASYSEYMK